MPLVAIAIVVAVLGVVLVARARPGGGRVPVGADPERSRRRHPRRAARPEGVAGHRARVCAGRRRPRGHLPDRRADRGRDRAAVPDAAAGAARDAGHGAAERRRLGAARGRDGVGVRRGRPRCGRRASPPPSSTASWCSSPACPAPSSSCWHGSVAPRRWSSPNRGATWRVPAGRRTERPMPDRPYTLLSCGMSIDGYLGSATPKRLALSNDADFDRVDAVRASCDAILVGAATVRNDNPRLLVRSQTRRDERTARGLAPSPIKVTVTERVELDALRRLLHHRRHREARLLRERAGGRRPLAARAGGDRGRRRPAGGDAHDQRGPRRARRAAADGRGRRQGAHAVPDRQPRRRAAAGRRSVLRRRLPGPAVRARRPLPLEPRPARATLAGRPPDRRRGAAALRALAAVPDRLDGEAAACHSECLTGDVFGSSAATAGRSCCRRSGSSRVALLSNNPDKAQQLRRFGVTVAGQVPTGVHLLPRTPATW